MKEQPKEYEIGDKVLLYSPNKQHKLMQNTTGPYKIKKVLGKRRYLLETLGGQNCGVVTGRRLIPWLDRNKVTVEVESHRWLTPSDFKSDSYIRVDIMDFP